MSFRFGFFFPFFLLTLNEIEFTSFSQGRKNECGVDDDFFLKRKELKL